ncbi:MAG: hypothetical protein LBI20_03970 [Holosporales bacterium]|jgi:hypothetical protein|nr:hypothetical protein [Holosporales bacterium]
MKLIKLIAIFILPIIYAACDFGTPYARTEVLSDATKTKIVEFFKTSPDKITYRKISGSRWIVTVNGEKFVFHLIRDKGALGAIRLASEEGVAPKIIYSSEQFVICKFIPGHILRPRDLLDPEKVKKLARLVKQVHSIPVSQDKKVCRFWNEASVNVLRADDGSLKLGDLSSYSEIDLITDLAEIMYSLHIGGASIKILLTEYYGRPPTNEEIKALDPAFLKAWKSGSNEEH